MWIHNCGWRHLSSPWHHSTFLDTPLESLAALEIIGNMHQLTTSPHRRVIEPHSPFRTSDYRRFSLAFLSFLLYHKKSISRSKASLKVWELYRELGQDI